MFKQDTYTFLLIFCYGEENIYIQIEYSSCVIVKTNSSDIVGPKQAINSLSFSNFFFFYKQT